MAGMGKEGPLCEPGSELLLGGSARVVRGQQIGSIKTKEEKMHEVVVKRVRGARLGGSCARGARDTQQGTR